MTPWEIHGVEFGNCNCNYGCPCQFNAMPTGGFSELHLSNRGVMREAA